MTFYSNRIRLPLNFEGPYPSDQVLWDYLGQEEAFELLGDRILQNESDPHRRKLRSASPRIDTDSEAFELTVALAKERIACFAGRMTLPKTTVITGGRIQEQLASILQQELQVSERETSELVHVFLEDPQRALQLRHKKLGELMYVSAKLFCNLRNNGSFAEVTVPFGNGASSLIFLGHPQGYSEEHLNNTLHHELTHALQYSSGYNCPLSMLGSPDSIFGLMEGLAIGVEGLMSQRLADQNGFIRGAYLREAQFLLCAAYALVSRRSGFSPDLDVMRVFNNTVKQSLREIEMMPHIVGFAAIAVAEARYGEEIFRKVLQGDGNFLDE